MSQNLCPECGAVWIGYRIVHCGRCHRMFADGSALDAHRTSTGHGAVCQDPATVRDRIGRRLLVERDGLWQRL